jgi:glycosyltransferase involved in cell wall biosynthesis
MGADRICYTAWQQVNGLVEAGVEVLLHPGVLVRPVPPSVQVKPTLAKGKLRIPYKVVGKFRAMALHDSIVARRLKSLVGEIDLVHTWPCAALHTIRAAAKLGIPSVLERPNAHTRFAYEIVQEECDRLGIKMPPGHEHEYNPRTLKLEEEEFAAADYLLCPSDFVARTFRDKGFPAAKLLRDQYGFDDKTYCPGPPRNNEGLAVLFVGGAAPRKGLHYALQAWLRSPASEKGTFTIAGAFIPGYAEKMADMLSHKSVRAFGHRKDIPELMRAADILVLPSIEEGSALVTSEARGSGCVLLVSDASGAICKHMENALVHTARDVDMLTEHMTMLHNDHGLLERLRAASLATVQELTWSTAGQRLKAAYRQAIANYHARDSRTVTA